jgi:hypothetical protein
MTHELLISFCWVQGIRKTFSSVPEEIQEKISKREAGN